MKRVTPLQQTITATTSAILLLFISANSLANLNGLEFYKIWINNDKTTTL